MIASIFCLLWPILYATGLIGMSTALSASETALIFSLNLIAGCILPLRGIWYLVLARRSGTRLQLSMLVQTILECLLSLAIIFLPRLSYQAFCVILGLFLSFYTVVQATQAYLYYRERIYTYFIPALCQAVAFPLLILALILLPDDLRYRVIMSGSGLLLHILGHAYVADWLAITLRNQRVASVFRKISVTMPGFSGLGVPFRLLATLRDNPPTTPPDAEIIFSFSKSGLGLAGHCELCVDGRTYTFGNYDPHSRTLLQTLGNGIVFCAERNAYIDFLVRQKRCVILYGLRLNDEQRAQLQRALEQLKTTLLPWRQEALRAPCKEYIRNVADELDAPIYRVTHGRFRSYFLPTINCVTLTGSLLQGTAAGNVVIPGVYTPGAYMELLHRLYIAGNDVVSSLHLINLNQP